MRRSLAALAGFGLVCLAVSGAQAGARDQLRHYPKSITGHERFVYVPEPRENEDDFGIELFGGKTMEIDCNRHRLAGSIVPRTVEGFGYDYYVLETTGMVTATRMGCPTKSKRQAFVSAKPITIRYNSKLPVVVFAPQGYSVRLRVWSALGEGEDMKKE
jgi:ecotin